MQRIVNFRTFNVFSIEKDVWDIDYHNHNFYEIILIEQGEGIHHLNQVKFNYKKNDVFLLTPSDAHSFEIHQKTKFIYIKYTEQFLLDALTLENNKNWKEALQLTLYQKPLLFESIIKDEKEAENLLQLAKILEIEFQSKNTYSNEIIKNLYATVMTIIVRNLYKNGSEKWVTLEGEKIEKILSYINIYTLDNDKMKIENLAKQFLMSKNYISLYVKKNTGFSIQNHIIQNKITIAERLLKQGKLNINEISSHLGFNDASHFHKIFKKYKNVSPSEWRRK